MTVQEARAIVESFDENKTTSDEDEFAFTEAMSFLIEEEHNPGDMMYLGGYYYGIKHFDLALKYYEMAAGYDYDPAYECLGYIWYYGRTGERNYEKAFGYFSKMMEKGNLVATYKVADMYKNGYFVEKNQAKYEEIIEDLYTKVKDETNLFEPVPEVFTRLANIRASQGRTQEAIDLFLTAKDFLAQRIRYSAFFGNLNIMKWLIDDLYNLMDFDEEDFDFYDLFYLLKTPHVISFSYRGITYKVKSEQEDAECAVFFEGKWFHDRTEFFSEAEIDNTRLTAICARFRAFRIRE